VLADKSFRGNRMLKIWGRVNSMNVQKVLWCCEELGIPEKRDQATITRAEHPELSHVRRWYGRMRQRKCFQKVVMTPLS
jgi:glutathione S-transferase